MRKIIAAVTLGALSACAAPAPPPINLGAEAVKSPLSDGAYVIRVDGPCGDGARFTIHNHRVSFASIFSGITAEGPVNDDGSFKIATAPNLSYGVTSLQLDPDGTGKFEVDNKYHPCTGKIIGVARAQ